MNHVKELYLRGKCKKKMPALRYHLRVLSNKFFSPISGNYDSLQKSSIKDDSNRIAKRRAD